MNRQSVYGLVGLIFVVSGALGLIYQIVWFKYISLFLGNTMYAQTIVVATFMGGLAIGAKLWGTRADAVRSPLILYGWLEMAVGFYCFLYPHFLRLVEQLFVSIVVSTQLPTDGSGVLLLKLLTSLLTLLPPTILMGGTLPVLVRYISRRIEESGRNVATLYFLNSFGAVVGSVLGGFFLVSMLGLSTTIYVTATLNVFVGLAAILINKIDIEAGGTEEQSTAEVARDFSPFQQNSALLVAGVSGFAAMIYEVGWVRLFIPVLGSSTYSFTLMLVGFIAGITIGSLIVSFAVGRIRNLFGFLSVCQLGIVLSMIAVLPLYGRLPYYFWHIAYALNRTPSTYPIFLTIEFLFGLALMIVPTIFLGMSLPAASRVAAKSINILGRSVGNVFSVNTLGTVAGSLAAGLFLIPLLGVKGTIEAAVLVNLALGVYILVVDRGYRPIPKFAALVSLLAVTGVYFVFGPDWNRAIELSGVFRQINRNTVPPISYAAYESINEAKSAVYYKEGAAATVAVLRSQTLDGPQHVLYINGKADASSIADLPTQVLLGQLPLLLHTRADSVLVVGLGSGVTAGSVLTHPVRSLDCVEISPEVVEAERFFEDVNHKPLADPRTHMFVEDALAYLKLTRNHYDAIISEPSNPWIAGIGNLYTTEFFSLARAHLNEGGIMVQWFHLYEMDDETFRLVLRTFESAFQNVSIWYSMAADVILIGTDRTAPFSESTIRERMLIPAVRDDLKRILITEPTTLLSLQALTTGRAEAYTTEGPLNTEDHPLLEYWAPRTFYINRGVTELPQFDERLDIRGGLTLLDRHIDSHSLTDDELYEIGMLHSTGLRGYPPLGYTVLLEYCNRHPKDYAAMDKLADVALVIGHDGESLRYRKVLADAQPQRADFLEKYAWQKFTRERKSANAFVPFNADESIRLLKRCTELCADTVDRYRVRLGDIYFSTGEYKRATGQYARALMLRETYEPDIRIAQDALLVQFARSLYRLGMRDRAAGYALQATWINPNNRDARNLIYTIWSAKIQPPADTVRTTVNEGSHGDNRE